jgi:hypothetical protein
MAISGFWSGAINGSLGGIYRRDAPRIKYWLNPYKKKNRVMISEKMKKILSKTMDEDPCGTFQNAWETVFLTLGAFL